MNTSPITADESRNQFLQLLVAQVQHQDPLQPVNQQEFVQQLAEFSTLEGIETLNARFADLLTLQNLTSGADLVGQQVRYAVDGTDREGRVSEVSAENGHLFVTIGTDTIPIDNIQALLDASP